MDGRENMDKGEEMDGGERRTWYANRSLKAHGKLVVKSNQKPPREERYCAATTRISSQYVSEISMHPVKN